MILPISSRSKCLCGSSHVSAGPWKSLNPGLEGPSPQGGAREPSRRGETTLGNPAWYPAGEPGRLRVFQDGVRSEGGRKEGGR